MPNLLASIELTSADTTPVAWADVLGMSAVVDVQSAESIILMIATVPLDETINPCAEFRFAVGGVREGPFGQAMQGGIASLNSTGLASFAYAKAGLSGSQTFSLQWQIMINAPATHTVKPRTLQIIEILPGDRLDILATLVDLGSDPDSAAAYATAGSLSAAVNVEDTESLILLAATLPINDTDTTDRCANCRLADGGVVEGGEVLIHSDSVFEAQGLTTLMRAKTGISGAKTFSLQWKTEQTNGAGKISISKPRTLQVLEFRPALFPVFESKATSVTSSSLTTHTIDTPAGVVSGDLLIAFIGLENITGSPQFSSWSDGFTEIKDKTTGGGAGASVGVAYKVSDGTEGLNITVDSVDAERAAHAMYRYSLHDSAIAPDISAGANALSAAPNPDSLTPAGGIKDFVYMVLAAYEKDDETITGFPANYGTNQTNHSMFSGATIGIADRELTASPEDPGVFAMSGAEEWQAFTLAIHPLPAPTIAITGTATASIEEEDILAGGKTIIVTLTNDTWPALGAPFDAIRQDIIDGLNSASFGVREWNNEVRDNEVVGAVVRTSDTVVTITLTAQPLYNQSDVTEEVITVTVPASALVTYPNAVVATPDFTIDRSPETCDVTGTADGSDEDDIVAGGRTIILTLNQDAWSTPFSSQQAIIDGLTSAQSELTGWNNEVRDKLPTSAVVLTDFETVTITLTAQAGYNITAPEVITATIPVAAVLNATSPIVATPDIDIAVGPATAVLTGTITPASTEAQIVAGGRTLIITLENDTWVASGAAFNAARQAIIDGITSAQAEVLGWNNEVRDNLPVGQVVRTSDTVVTVSFVPETAYNITDFEEITVTVPASAVLAAAPIVATPTFVIFEVPTAVITGTATPEVTEADVVTGGKTIIVTLIDDEFVTQPTFDATRSEFRDGITSAQSELLGWNNEVRPNIPLASIVRTSATVATITLPASASYDITQNETISVEVPGAILDQTPNNIIGVPTFTVIKEAGSHMRSRRGGKHAEDLFDVNEPDVQTFEVNKFE